MFGIARTPRSMSRCRAATLKSESMDEMLALRRRSEAEPARLRVDERCEADRLNAVATLLPVFVRSSGGRRGPFVVGTALGAFPSPRSMSACACSQHGSASGLLPRLFSI